MQLLVFLLELGGDRRRAHCTIQNYEWLGLLPGRGRSKYALGSRGLSRAAAKEVKLIDHSGIVLPRMETQGRPPQKKVKK